MRRWETGDGGQKKSNRSERAEAAGTGLVPAIEQGNADDVYYHPKNEYTKNLINSIPGKNLNYSR